VLVLTAVYAEYAAQPAVAGALKGMGAVAAGLIVGTGLKLAHALRANPMGVPVCIGLAVLAFVTVALLRWPLVWVLLALGLVACAYAWKQLPGATTRYPDPSPVRGEGE
jgi:chromate transporter